MSKQWYVYILECRDGTLYTGITDDISRRVEQHNSGNGAKYTRGRGPVVVRYTERVLTKSDALKRELAIKSLTRSEKLALIESALSKS